MRIGGCLNRESKANIKKEIVMRLLNTRNVVSNLESITPLYNTVGSLLRVETLFQPSVGKESVLTSPHIDD